MPNNAAMSHETFWFHVTFDVTLWLSWHHMSLVGLELRALLLRGKVSAGAREVDGGC